MQEMVARFATLWPEIAVLIGGVLCLFTGLSPVAGLRRATPWVAGLALAIAAILVPTTMPGGTEADMMGLASYVKLAVIGVGLVLLLNAAGVPGELTQTRQAEAARRFEPGDIMRGEFFAFFLFSLTGVMLTVGATDLVWLFLALELTSLPTYVMVSIGRDHIEAQESGVKYFFLGALSAAVFLYGFALIYGATGTTDLEAIRLTIARMGAAGAALPPLLIAGMVLAFLGICFKIAAAPMHFYAADVYEGAATPVTAFLAFVPKTAGFIAMILLLNTVGWPLPATLAGLVWLVAVLTMTFGNVLALMQDNVKRVLAYSSIAHSGYLLVGLYAGPALMGGRSVIGLGGGGALGDGLGGVLFYLVAYGLGTIAAFAVLGCLTVKGEEAQTYDDIAGLARRQPVLGALMLLSMLSLLGIPPLVGFLGKIYLFAPAFTHGGSAGVWLVVIGVLNSAISAAYYLKIASVCFFGTPSDSVRPEPVPARVLAAAVAAIGTLVLGVAGRQLVEQAHMASPRRQPIVAEQPHSPGSPSSLATARELPTPPPDPGRM